MSSNYKGFSLRKRFFWMTIAVVFLNIAITSIITYSILNSASQEFSRTELQRKSDAIISAIDYAISQEEVYTQDIPIVLKSKILEIADINKQDIFIYNLDGSLILANKPSIQIVQKKIPQKLLHKIHNNSQRFDIREFDEQESKFKTSSYAILNNNFLEPIGIIYLPYFHNDNLYTEYVMRYLPQLITLIILMIIFIVVASYFISKGLTHTITKFAERMNQITLFNDEYKPIRYYKNDELGALAKAYNKMMLKLQEQRERLAFNEKEKAWREMARQVAHEVKTPLTPMRMTIQRFALKFDPEQPNIREKVQEMTDSVIRQIDTISAVANAFSQFTQLPEKNDEVFDLVKEVKNMLNLYNDDPIHLHSNEKSINIKMDKVYLNRILTNLIANAQQASKENEKAIINVDIEKTNKRVHISVQDRGVGIDRSMFDKIFEPNFSTKNSGMGLGLTMVKKMIEDYNGVIELNSEVNVGTTFKISLPTNQ